MCCLAQSKTHLEAAKAGTHESSDVGLQLGGLQGCLGCHAHPVPPDGGPGGAGAAPGAFQACPGCVTGNGLASPAPPVAEQQISRRWLETWVFRIVQKGSGHAAAVATERSAASVRFWLPLLALAGPQTLNLNLPLLLLSVQNLPDPALAAHAAKLPVAAAANSQLACPAGSCICCNCVCYNAELLLLLQLLQCKAAAAAAAAAVGWLIVGKNHDIDTRRRGFPPALCGRRLHFPVLPLFLP